MSAPTRRLEYIESVRGLAAFAVVLSHLVFVFAFPDPTGVPTTGEQLTPAARAGLRSAFWPIADGRFAVMIFFVLSGIALSQGYLRSGRQADLQSACIRRYFRLALPCLISTLLACALWKAGLMHHQSGVAYLAGEGVPTKWLTAQAEPEGGWHRAVRQALWDVFFGPADTQPATLFSCVLWTMRYEFIGSFLVFAFLALFGRHPRASGLCVLFTVVLAASGEVMLSLFPVGVWIAIVREQEPEHRYPLWLSVLLCLAACGISGLYDYHEAQFVMLPIFNSTYNSVELAPAAAAVLLVSGVAFSRHICSWLAARPLVWLGKISFGLYLTHLLLILSFGMWAYLTLRSNYEFSHLTAVAMVVSTMIPLSLLGGWGMYYIADRPAVALGKWVSAKVLETPK